MLNLMGELESLPLHYNTWIDKLAKSQLKEKQLSN